MPSDSVTSDSVTSGDGNEPSSGTSGGSDATGGSDALTAQEPSGAASRAAGDGTAPPVRRITVGVDGSGTSVEALRWAADAAARRGADLLVLLAWQVPYISPYLPTVPLSTMDWEQNARETLAPVLADVFGARLPAGVHAEVREGSAAQVLIDAGKDSDLVVIGSRGHGGVVGMLLGSVSTAVVHHAPCAVLVVRPRPDSDGH